MRHVRDTTPEPRSGAVLRWRALAGGLVLGLAAVGWLRAPRAPLLIVEAARLAAEEDRPTLVFVFSPRDCAAEYAAIDSLNALARDGTASVLGVVALNRGRFDNWTDLIRAHGIRFPVVSRSPAKVQAALAQLGHSGTPALVGIDAAQRFLFATAQPSDPTLYAFVRSRVLPRRRPVRVTVAPTTMLSASQRSAL